MTTTLHVHRARLDMSADVEALTDLRWAWRVVERGGMDGTGMERPVFDAAFAAWVAGHAETNVPFLAHVGGHTVGMAWLALVERIPGPERWERRAGLVQSVYVLPEFRDRGVGTALMTEVKAAAAEQRLDYLMVHPTERSVPFYRRHGFGDADGTLELELVAGR